MIKQYGLGINNFSFMTFGFGAAIYNPVTLFAAGQQGVIYDPSDLTTLFQDAAGTVPVTKSGDPVGLMKDKSGNNNHAVQTLSTARPLYQTDGILHWLKPDGVDDFFDSVGLVPYNGSAFFVSTAVALTAGTQYLGLWRFLRQWGSSTGASDNFLEEYTATATPRIKVVAQRYPSYSLIYSEVSERPASGVNQISWSSNSSTGSKTQVMPSQPNPINLGVKTLTSGNATLSILRGYGGGVMAGRFYGFIWLSDEITDAARDSANAYLAIKSGVTL